MKKTYTIPVLALLVLLPSLLSAQRIRDRWKGYRAEVIFSLGASNFLGELGGANQIGTNYFKDLEFSQTRPAIGIGMRYRLSPLFAITSQITHGQVRGDDALTEEFFRNYRNLSFKSNITEFTNNLEFSFLREQAGHRYRLRGVKGLRGFEMAAYGFVGAGLFKFNPKAELNGEWYELQPLGTEGQGVLPTRKKYSRIQFVVPVGIGFKYTFNRRLGIGLEMGLRKTFTDYVDDVSTTYYDNGIIAENNGYIAALLADRSNQEYPRITVAGQQRGDPTDKDSYMFVMLNASFKLRTSRVAYPLF
ncbi:MAG TPA: DUF6089 family protein [Bacteroidia bacterium]|nr:DUF6089 family protein [Bacteroidia bacterium]HNT79713.1 DUF6089 family protein [Bacteroidia bacterium]